MSSTTFPNTIPRVRPAPATPRPFGAHAALTLVEMLLVLGVVTFLLASVVPAVRALASSSGTTGACEMLLATLDQARGLAMARGGNALVVFADDQFPTDSAPFQSCQILFEPGDGSGSPEAVGRPIRLPAGVIFVPDVPGVFSVPAPCRLAVGQLGSWRNAVATDEVALPAIIFDASGGVVWPVSSESRRIFLAPGHTDAEANAVVTGGLIGIRLTRFTGRAERIPPAQTPSIP